MAVIKIVPMPGAVGDKGDPGETGAQGPQGETGQTGQNGQDALWNYNGEYNPGAGYAVGDVVVYQGQLYYTKSVTTAGTLPTNTTKFDLIAAKGADGTNGTNGADGATPFTLIGAYDNGASYNLGIAVYYNGGTYVRTGNPLNPGYPPEVGAINASWTPIAEKGEPGTDVFAEDGTLYGPTNFGGLKVLGLINSGDNDLALQSNDADIYLQAGSGIVQIAAPEITLTSNAVPSSVNINTYSGAVINSARTSTYDAENKVVATLGDLPTGATGTFQTSDSKIVTVINGIITSIESLT